MSQTAKQIRPKTLDDFIGNKKAIELVKDRINVCKTLNKTFPHSLIVGPAGHGKTLLAELISTELNAEFIYVNSTSVTDPISFRELMRQAVLHDKSVIMLDEFHELAKKVRANSLSLLEYPSILCTPGLVDLHSNQIKPKLGAITKEELPDGVTFICATNYIANIEETIITRLMEIRLFEYSLEDKAEIAKTALARAKMQITDSASKEIAKRSKDARGISKVCEMLADAATILGNTQIVLDSVLNVFGKLGIDENGCGQIEHSYMRYLAEMGKASAESIAAFLHLNRKDIVAKIEPFLIRKNFVMISSSGRHLTEKGYIAIGYNPTNKQTSGGVAKLK